MAQLRAALQSDFFRHLSVLMGGTIVAQLIPLMVLPILSRSYTPEAFAVLALMLMGAYFTASLSTGNFEQAIPSARSMRRAKAVATITLFFSIAFAVLYSVVLVVFYAPIARVLQLGAFAPWMFAVPFTLMFGGFSITGNYWLLRAGMPTRQVGIKLVHACVNAALAVGFGMIHGLNGLFYAFVVATAFAAAWAMYWSRRSGLRLLHVRQFRYLLSVMRHYRAFPLLGALPTALSSLAIQLPLILVTAYFSLTVAGHFSVIRNLLSGGLILVSFCIGQVLMKHLSSRIRAGVPLWPMCKKVMLVVALLGLAGGVLLFVAGPSFLNVYLGKGWEDSGAILRMLAISSPFIVLGASLAPALVAIGRIRFMGLWQLAYFLCSLALLMVINLPFEQFLAILVAIETVVYALFVPFVCYHVRRFDRLQALKS